MTKHLDVVNARVVGMAVVVYNVQAQRVSRRRHAAAGFFARENLLKRWLSTNQYVARM